MKFHFSPEEPHSNFCLKHPPDVSARCRFPQPKGLHLLLHLLLHSHRSYWGEGVNGLTYLRNKAQRAQFVEFYHHLKDSRSQLHQIDEALGRGDRTWRNAATANAVVAVVEGLETELGQQHAGYAKRCLLDNKLNIDPVGFELSHNASPMPSPEWNSYGYYSVDDIYDLVYAYDLLIESYRSNSPDSGITAIEDLKIRDQLARWVAVNLQEYRGYEGDTENRQQVASGPSKGMWDFARHSGSAIIAMAMPDYSTPYYGVSRAEGLVDVGSEGVPFEGAPRTWQDIYQTGGTSLSPTPGQRVKFDHLDGGLITEDGFFYDRISYFSYGLMGHCFEKFAMSSAAVLGQRYPYLEKAFERATAGTLKGLKVRGESDAEEKYFPTVLIANAYFEDLAPAVIEAIEKQPKELEDGSTNPLHLDHLLYSRGAFGFVWYDNLWESHSLKK